VEQVECVNSRILEVIDAAPAAATVVLMSDHGPDSLGQLLTPTARWDTAQTTERMSILSAIRTEGPCDETPRATGPNVFRVLFNCTMGTDLPLLEERMFAVNVEENLPHDVTTELFIDG
jgi:hypothetical protein